MLTVPRAISGGLPSSVAFIAAVLAFSDSRSDQLETGKFIADEECVEGAELNSGDSGWKKLINHRGAQYISVGVQVLKTGSTAWSIEFSGSSMFPQDRIESQSFSSDPSSISFFSRRIEGDSVWISILGADESSHFCVIGYVVGNLIHVKEQVIHPNDLFVLDEQNANSTLVELGKSVAGLVIIEGQAEHPCSGFLISDRHVMTNFHCVAYANVLGVTASFGFGHRSTNGEEIVRLSPIPIASSLALDFAVLEVLEPQKTATIAPLTLNSAINHGDPLQTIQHPARRSKMAVIKNCITFESDRAVGEVHPDPNVLEHSCDSMDGSSGSPVFNLDGDVIALHRAALKKDKKNPRNLSTPMSQIIPSLISTGILANEGL